MYKKRSNLRNRSAQSTNLPGMRGQKKGARHTVNIDKIKSIDLTSIFRKYSKQVTTLSPRSLTYIRQFIPKKRKSKIIRRHELKAKPAGHEGAHLSYLMAELKEVELDKVQLDKRGYNEFKKQFKRMVFDHDGNYLYTKAADESQQKLQQNMILSKEIVNTKQVLKQIRIKTAKLSPAKIMERFRMETQEQTEKYCRSYEKTIVDLMKGMKDRTYKSFTKLQANRSIAVIRSQMEQKVEEFEIDSKKNIQFLIQENASLKQKMKSYRIQKDDKILENSALKRRNQMLKDQIHTLAEINEKVRVQNKSLQEFKPTYDILMKSFPEEKIESILEQYKNFQDEIIRMKKQLDHQEDDFKDMQLKHNRKHDKILDKVQYQQDEIDRKTKLVQEKLHIIDDLQQISEQETKFESLYMNLQRQVTFYFNKWTELIPHYGRIHNGMVPDIKSPKDMLETMDKTLKISTDALYLKQIGKIMVSAKDIMRKFFPEQTNKKYDPAKIYEQVVRYIKELHKQIDEHKHKISELGIKLEDYEQKKAARLKLEAEEEKKRQKAIRLAKYQSLTKGQSDLLPNSKSLTTYNPTKPSQ